MTNYAVIAIILVVVAVLGITSYLGVTQAQNMHIDNGETVLKNITVQSKEVVNRQYVITDTENIKYITSEQNELKMTKGHNFTISVATINNNTGYWIATSNEIVTPKTVIKK
jgi:uncharacterized protein HemX